MATPESPFPSVVETDRLRLERWDDAVDPVGLYRLHRSEEMARIRRYFPDDPDETLEETVSELADAGRDWAEFASAAWAVRPRADEDGAGDLAGNAALMVEWDRRVAYLGLWLRPAFWGRGYSGERAAAVLHVAFERLDLDLVSVGHHPENEQSRRAIEKYVDRFGGRREGRFRNLVPTDARDEEPHDLVTYTIRQADWREAVNATADPTSVTVES